MPLPQGGTARAQGKYVDVWKRQPDGSITLVVDIFNTNS
jgi:ketosteroid isomerase-like protein